MRRLAKYFISGLLFLIPVMVSVYIVYWVFSTVDRLVRELSGQQWEDWIPGLGVVISLAVITGVGVLSSLFITRPILQLVEKIFERVPLIKLLYSSIKDLVGAFVGDKKKFDKPVLVKLTRDGDAKLLGFITSESLEFLSIKDEVSVYCPHSYNFSGCMIIVPRDQVTPIDADSSEVMAFIVSGGVSSSSVHLKKEG